VQSIRHTKQLDSGEQSICEVVQVKLVELFEKYE